MLLLTDLDRLEVGELYPGQSRVNTAAMRCATNVSIVPTFFVAVAILATFSDAARLPIHDGAISGRDGVIDVDAATVVPTEESKEYETTNIQGVGHSRTDTVSIGEVPSQDCSLAPPILEADMQESSKWYLAAVRSNDSTILDRMLGLCRGHEEKYAEQLNGVLKAVCYAQKWSNLAKIIKAMCMDLDRFKWTLFYMLERDIMRDEYAPSLVPILEAIAGKMDQMPEIIGTLLVTLAVTEPKYYREIAEQISLSVTDIELRELSAIAMIEEQEQRLTAFDYVHQSHAQKRVDVKCNHKGNPDRCWQDKLSHHGATLECGAE